MSPSPRATRRRLLSGLVAAGGLAALSSSSIAPLFGCAAPQTGDARDPTAHPLSGLTDFDGRPLPPPDLLGHATVVDFWASWCAPCRQAFRYMDQLYRTYAGDGLLVIGVSVDEDPSAGRRFAAMQRPRFQTAWDMAGAVRDRFQVMGLPTTFLLDENAQLVLRTEGFDVTGHRALEDHVRRLVRAA